MGKGKIPHCGVYDLTSSDALLMLRDQVVAKAWITVADVQGLQRDLYGRPSSGEVHTSCNRCVRQTGGLIQVSF